MSRTENSQNSDKKRDSRASRQRAFITAYFKNAFNASAACRDCGINRSTFKKWMAEDPKFVDELHAATDARLDEAEGALMDLVRQGNVAATIFFLKAQGKQRGWIEGSPVKVKDIVSAKAAEILSGVLAGSIKPEDAGIMFDQIGLPLPEGLKLLIQKSEVAETPSDDGWNQSAIEEDLDRLYADRMAAIAEQESEFVPQRQEEVKKIKDELKDFDSFSPEATGGDGKKQP